MKTPEEIKKDLVSQIASSICRNCPHCLTALELIEQLEAAQPKWISVEERLPEPQDYEGEPIEYIVHVEGAELATFALFDGKRFIPSEFPGFIENRMFAGPITHWMPLPEPPKEDS